MWDNLNTVLSSTEITSSTALVRLLISFIFGASIGLERQYRRREAGLRTFTLICLGSTAAMLISIWIPQSYPNFLNGDPGRIAAQVLSGIGCRSHYPEQRERAWIDYGCLYLGSSRNRTGYWCRYADSGFDYDVGYVVCTIERRTMGTADVLEWSQ